MMGRPAEQFARRLMALGAAAAILVGHAQLEADERAGPSRPTEDGLALPLEPPPAPEPDPYQDRIDTTNAQFPAESLPQLQERANGGTRASVYPPFYEDCRYSRVYRSSLLGRLWGRAEYLVWATKGADLPALVTSSPLGTDPDQAGVLGQAGTSILFGGRAIHDEMRSAGRLTLGFWWDPCQMGGIEMGYFGLPAKEVRHFSQGAGDAIVARPFLDVTTAEQDALLVAYPDILDGSIDIRADVELQGAEVLLRRVAVCRPGFQVDLLAGYRYARLLDRLTIDEFSQSLPPPLPPSGEYDPGTVLWEETDRFDLFKTTNDFHGAQAGLIAQWTRGRWSLELLGKVALGGTSTRSVADGATTITTTTATEEGTETTTGTYDGGLLALPTNIGYFRDSEFTVFSELEVSLRYELACDLWFSVGYNLLHWNRVGRSADQIDSGINPTQIPPGTLVGEPRPEFNLNRTDFWAQGLNLRLEQQF